MKKTAAIVIMAILVGGFHAEVKAQENGINGFLLGAGGGALIGQVIGRNTESTLIGTAVGSMLGYVIGNEREQNGTIRVQTTHRPVQRVYTIPLRQPVRQYIIIEDNGRRNHGRRNAAYLRHNRPRHQEPIFKVVRHNRDRNNRVYNDRSYSRARW